MKIIPDWFKINNSIWFMGFGDETKIISINNENGKRNMDW